MRKLTDDVTAGELRTLIEVQRPSYSPDGAGGQSKIWTKVAEIWCHIEEVSGGETYGDASTGRVRSLDKWAFISWWRDDIMVTDRLVYQGDFFNIQEVNNVLLRNKFLRLVAERGVEQ